ncbi:Uncharacterized protein Adt_21696 [Abeliophyllum distichum]|uniref:Ribonuclease H1 N-terminal domain-containing protein n=1 Tax=Abeliophyllum distichum TaxID=126358 RepID=A0ABD1T0A4_9LAMI
MADLKNQIADIKEEIEIKKLEISTAQQKITILEKKLARLEGSLSKETNKGAWTALGKLPDIEVSKDTKENETEGKIKTVEQSQAQCSKEQIGIQSPKETLQPLVGINTSAAGTKFYVVFDGPQKGFYTNWAEVEAIVKNKPYKHKSFKTYTEAQQTFFDNCESKGINPIPYKQVFDLPVFRPQYQQIDIRSRPRLPAHLFNLHSENARLHMFTYKEAVQSSTGKIHDRFTSLGKIPKTKEENTILNIPIQEFLTLEAEARVIGDSAPEETYFGTFDKKFGQFVFLEGVDPTLVQSTFHCELIKMIIPGDDLEDIKLLDSGLVQSIRDFKKFVIKNQDSRLILKFNSTIPFWDESEVIHKGYHHIQIRTVQEILLDRPIKGEPTDVDDTVLQDWRALSFQRILTSLKSFNRNSKIKINHSSRFILMTSRTSATISIEGIKTICKFEEKFYNSINAPDSYDGHLCKALKSSLRKYHECQLCHRTDQTDRTSPRKEESGNSDADNTDKAKEKVFSDED